MRLTTAGCSGLSHKYIVIEAKKSLLGGMVDDWDIVACDSCRTPFQLLFGVPIIATIALSEHMLKGEWRRLLFRKELRYETSSSSDAGPA